MINGFPRFGNTLVSITENIRKDTVGVKDQYAGATGQLGFCNPFEESELKASMLFGF